MEIQSTFRIIVTVLGFLCFLGICFWAYSRRAAKGFDEAALLPFNDDDPAGEAESQQSRQGKENG